MKSERLQLLKKFKKADLKSDVPSVSITNAKFLHALIIDHTFKSGLEIGTAHAYSTIWLADAFEQNQGKLTTIEHSPPSFDQAKINLFRAKLEKTVTQHLGRAQVVIEQKLSSNSSYDFIFIDGIKKSTKEFFQLFSPRLEKKGIIVIDDVIKFKDKMQDFYDFLATQSEWAYTVHQLDKDDGIMTLKRA
jgi:predicted O-methyltransferase YrrM